MIVQLLCMLHIIISTHQYNGLLSSSGVSRVAVSELVMHDPHQQVLQAPGGAGRSPQRSLRTYLAEDLLDPEEDIPDLALPLLPTGRPFWGPCSPVAPSPALC